ncbi:MAG: SET domain-containing protein [Phycisphaerales bacterium]
MTSHRWLAVRSVRNGRGIVALRAFARGATVLRIRGRLLHSDALWRAWERDPRLAANCFRYDQERYLSPRGTVADFANHSCRPNTAIVRVRGGLALRALRRIERGEEILHDYATLLGADDVWTMRCNCGERGCRKVVRRFDALPTAVLARYLRLRAIPRHILETAPERVRRGR